MLELKMKNPLLKPLVYLARRCSTRILVLLLIFTTFTFVFLLLKYISAIMFGPQLIRKPIYADWIDKYDSGHDGDDVVIVRMPSKVESGSLVGGNNKNIINSELIDDGVTTIAIGCAITTRNNDKLNLENLAYQLPFVRTLLPSFCKTASAGYKYNFYIAFDALDQHLRKHEILSSVYARFTEVVKLLCPRKSNFTLNFVQCRHDRSPSWAQNDAMMEAYLDHADYYYRVNDDTLMQTPGWTETFIEGLNSFTPPNVGVVGPLHAGGNTDILTYDFVHRTHIDIFGYYYPRIFTDWWADNWMSSVYGTDRTLKLPSVRLQHTGEAGTRYQITGRRERYLKEQVQEDQATLKRYLISLDKRSEKKTGVHVISMSLWGSSPRYTFGALRNAQLAPVYFPGWILRFYVEQPRDDGSTTYSPVPDRILTKLKRLGGELVGVDATSSRVPPMMWRFLAADDDKIDVFIVRDSDCRLNDRDAIVVADWLSGGDNSAPFHCIRDHPSHGGYPLLGGLWGAKPRLLSGLVKTPWKDLMMGHRADYIQDMNFLAQAIWPKVEKHSLCHDSVSCIRWNARPFPVKRFGTEHLGQVFDAFGNARDEDIQIIMEHDPVPRCTVVKNSTLYVLNNSSSAVSVSKTQSHFANTVISSEVRNENQIELEQSDLKAKVNNTSRLNLSNKKAFDENDKIEDIYVAMGEGKKYVEFDRTDETKKSISSRSKFRRKNDVTKGEPSENYR